MKKPKIKVGKVVDVGFSNDHFTLRWEINNIGWGEFCFYYKKGKIYVDNEYMDKKTIKKVMAALVDKAILENK